MDPTFSGVHHLKLPVADLEINAAWFGRAFGARREERFDHRDENGSLYAVMMFLPGVPSPVELRHAPDAAAAVAGYDPVTFGVADEDALDNWITHLDEVGIEHSDKVRGYIGEVIAVPTPDGLTIRIYTDPAGGFDDVEMHPERADIHHAQLSTSLMSGGH